MELLPPCEPERLSDGGDAASDATVSDDETPGVLGHQDTDNLHEEIVGSALEHNKDSTVKDEDESDATISDSSCTHTDDERDAKAGNGSDTEGEEVEKPLSWEEEKERFESNALLMRELWRTDHAQWLERSKKDWRELRHKRRRMVGKPQRFDYLKMSASHSTSGDSLIKPQKTSQKTAQKTASKPVISSRQTTVDAYSFAAKIEQVREQAKLKLIQQAKVKVLLKGGGLKVLLREGLVESGEEMLYIQYLNQTYRAALASDGCIEYEGQRFASPSAWSIFVKRLANPSKKADDGWKSVRYAPTSQTLEAIKDRLHQIYSAKTNSLPTTDAPLQDQENSAKPPILPDLMALPEDEEPLSNQGLNEVELPVYERDEREIATKDEDSHLCPQTSSSNSLLGLLPISDCAPLYTEHTHSNLHEPEPCLREQNLSP